MIRILVENLLLFLLPTFLYLAYVFFNRATSEKDENGDTAAAAGGLLDDAPLLYLFAAGVFLVVATLVVFGSNTGGKPNQPYVPPAIKDGRIEPGHVE
jgi:TRAP-type mannitol/chloroaromatic compound transport system permease small subunit